MFGATKKTLIVVYKDEMLMNQLKKLVETNDDNAEGQVVGTTDGSINIVSWEEKVWLNNKKAGNIKDKVLFLGDIKGTDKLIPVIDVKFDECGVKYGWAGNQAVLYADAKALNSRDMYSAFVERIKDYPVPDMIKKPLNLNFDEVENEEKESSNKAVDSTNEGKDKKKAVALLHKAKEAIAVGADVVGKTGNALAVKAEDVLRDRNAVKRQMLFFGLVNLYRDGLETFVNN